MTKTVLERESPERISERLSLYRASLPEADPSFADDVAFGLTLPE